MELCDWQENLVEGLCYPKRRGNDCAKGKWFCLVFTWMILGNRKWGEMQEVYEVLPRGEGIWHVLSFDFTLTA
jgi:hypothetical protein